LTRSNFQTFAQVPVQRAFNFSRNEYWVVELDREVEPGSVVWLEMSFSGSMLGRLNGLYRTSYVDSRTHRKRFHLQYHLADLC